MFISLLIILLALASYLVFYFLKGKKQDSKAQHILAVTLSGVFALTVAGLYSYLGSPKKTIEQQAIQQDASAYADLLQNYKNKSPDELIAAVNDRLKKQDNSAQGWFLLGKLYNAKQDYPAANDAFAKAYALAPNDIEINAAYAQVIYLQNQGHITPEALKMLYYVISQSPRHPGALNLLATIAYNEKNYQLALNSWQQIVDNFPPDTQAGKTIRIAMDNAKQQLTQQTEAGVRSLLVTVSLDDSISDALIKPTTLFIIVKEAEGAQSPIWVKKDTVNTLPKSYTLTADNAMILGRLLPKDKKLQVVARLSVNGQPFANKGDSEGEQSLQLSNSDKGTVHVVINKRIN